MVRVIINNKLIIKINKTKTTDNLTRFLFGSDFLKEFPFLSLCNSELFIVIITSECFFNKV